MRIIFHALHQKAGNIKAITSCCPTSPCWHQRYQRLRKIEMSTFGRSCEVPWRAEIRDICFHRGWSQVVSHAPINENRKQHGSSDWRSVGTWGCFIAVERFMAVLNVLTYFSKVVWPNRMRLTGSISTEPRLVLFESYAYDCTCSTEWWRYLHRRVALYMFYTVNIVFYVFYSTSPNSTHPPSSDLLEQPERQSSDRDKHSVQAFWSMLSP